ncbi:MAG TPA: ATP-binding cassette domain-containing protein [Longimicrobiales bacterium]|nr:ATP-binding cassette domain-containing protein [Longimicrobiales bacterium]
MKPTLATIRNVRKRFATVTAVDDFSLDVEQGGITALLGPNGAGKSTVIRMLLGLIEPDAGSIEYHGVATTARGPDPRQVGFLPEDRGLYPDVEVLRTLVYFGRLRGMERAAARAAADRWLARMSLEGRAREPLKSLSKGNQQKIQFISAVLHRPRFAVLDEPFSGLDPLNQDFFLDLIRELRDEGTTVLLSAHQMQLVERIADRVIVMNLGQTVVSGTLSDVRRRWTTGSRLLVRVGSPPPDGFFADRAPAVTVMHPEADAVELFIADGVPLGPLLAEVGTALDVRGIESRPVTLHDVYVGAIAQHNGGRVPDEIA